MTEEKVGRAGSRMPKSGWSEINRRNERLWDERANQYQAMHGAQLAAKGGLAWGVWQLPESQLQILGEVRDRDILEFGCGAAQWSIALHAMGARVTGVDISARQLEHARRLMKQSGADFPLIQSNAETTPLPNEAFDIIFCDHGAMTFADPHRTIPEAARLLRPGGLLAFSTSTPVLDMAWPLGIDHPADKLVYSYWDLHILQEPNEPVAFQLPYGTWIRLFRENGLNVESLVELRPPEDATSSYRNDVDRAWARRWPMEHIWRVRRTA